MHREAQQWKYIVLSRLIHINSKLSSDGFFSSLLCITKLHVAEQGLQCAGRYLELVQTPVILQEMIAWKCRELVVGARHGISLSDQDWPELGGCRLRHRIFMWQIAAPLEYSLRYFKGLPLAALENENISKFQKLTS